MRLRAVLLAGVCCVISCIDVEGAYDTCVREGRCTDSPANADAGATDAGDDGGAPDGGSGADDAGQTDAGGGGDGGSDGGTTSDAGFCPGSPFPRLQCGTAQRIMDAGSSVSLSGRVASNDLGFIAVAYTESQLELRVISSAGAQVDTLQRADLDNPAVGVDGAADLWVLAYSREAPSELSCLTSVNATVTVMLDAGVGQVAASMSPSGAVALGVRPINGLLYAGRSVAGCPSSLSPVSATSPDYYSIAVAHTPADGGDGFRYASIINDGSVARAELMSIEPNGAVTRTSVATRSELSLDARAAASASGARIFIALSSLVPDGGQELDVVSTPSDLTQQPGALTAYGREPGFWAISPCGTGCMATAIIPLEGGPSTVVFSGDGSDAGIRGRFDVLCNLPPALEGSQTIGVAHHQGKLGILHTRVDAGAEFLICDLPQL